MEKRYQVFVSSTYEDLREERAAVIQSLLESDCIPAGMELFPASDDTQWELIKRVIDESDYYLVIVAGRYGSRGKEGVGYTEMEYDYAVSVKKPIMGFVHQKPGSLPADQCESDDKGKKLLELFRSKVKGRTVKMWTNPDDLAGKVARSLNQMKTIHAAEGWVKARYASDPESIVKMRARIDQLESELKSARTTAPPEAADLCQGDDEFEFVIGWENALDDLEWTTLVQTWDRLFQIAGPVMFDEASEEKLQEVLCESLRDDLSESEGLKEVPFVVRLGAESFHTIIVQFRALGLIEKSNRKRRLNENQAYWKLTPFGETHVTRLVAERRTQ